MRALSAPLAFAVLLLTAPAAAEPDARAQAAGLFEGGAQAYDAGQYLVAAEAFVKANKLLPSPSFVFSAAQAYRREYLARPNADVLRKAVALYREYLVVDPKGKRRDETMTALESLVPLEARLPAPGGDAPAKEAEPAGARLLLSAKPDGSEVSLDGGAYGPTPLVAKVKPGPHVARFRAPGYFEEQIDVRAVEGELIPGAVTLRAKPASIEVKGADGARLLLDGQPKSTLPGPVSVEPGEHAVALILRGHRPWFGVVDLKSDERKALDVRLRPTEQRYGAVATLALGGLAGAVSIGLLGATLARQADALALDDLRTTTGLGPADRDRYNAALADRNALGLGAAITGGLSAVALAVGTGLYLLDEPDPTPPNRERRFPKPKIELQVGFGTLGVLGSF